MKRNEQHLIDTLERRHRFALVLIEGGVDNTAVFELDVWASGIVLE